MEYKSEKFLKDLRVFKELLNDLSPREKGILEKRFGVKFDISLTLEKVGKEFGVTRERIRQIEVKSLAKLHYRLEELLKAEQKNV